MAKCPLLKTSLGLSVCLSLHVYACWCKSCRHWDRLTEVSLRNSDGRGEVYTSRIQRNLQWRTKACFHSLPSNDRQYGLQISVHRKVTHSLASGSGNLPRDPEWISQNTTSYQHPASLSPQSPPPLSPSQETSRLIHATISSAPLQTSSSLPGEAVRLFLSLCIVSIVADILPYFLWER